MSTMTYAAARLGDLSDPSLPALDLPDGGAAELSQADYRGRTYVFKRYHEELRSVARADELGRMLRWRCGLGEDERSRLDAVAAWPRHIVWDGDRLLGVLTPRAPGAYLAGPRPRTLDRLAMTMDAGAGRTLGRSPESIKLSALGHLVDAVLHLHALGVVINDLYAHNVLVSAFGDAVLLVDCDSMTGEHWEPVLPVNLTPEWIRTAVPGVDRPTRATDLARLALVVITTMVDPDLERIGPRDVAGLARLLGSAVDAEFVCRTLQEPDVGAVAVQQWRELGARWRTASATAAAPAPEIVLPLPLFDPVGGPLLPVGHALPRLDHESLHGLGLIPDLDLADPDRTPGTSGRRPVAVREALLVLAVLAVLGAALLWWVAP
jgi:hypothetical protein